MSLTLGISRSSAVCEHCSDKFVWFVDMHHVVEFELEHLASLDLRWRERKGVAWQFRVDVERHMEEGRVTGLGNLSGKFLSGGGRDEQQSYFPPRGCGGTYDSARHCIPSVRAERDVELL